MLLGVTSTWKLTLKLNLIFNYSIILQQKLIPVLRLLNTFVLLCTKFSLVDPKSDMSTLLRKMVTNIVPQNDHRDICT